MCRKLTTITRPTGSAAVTAMGILAVPPTGVLLETVVLTSLKLAIMFTVTVAGGSTGGTLVTSVARATPAGTSGVAPGYIPSNVTCTCIKVVCGSVTGIVLYVSGMVCRVESDH